MIGVRAFGLYQHRRSEDFQKLLDQVRRLEVGCVVIFESEVGSLPTQINALQQASDVPLLIAADMERGMNFRIRRGVVPLPSAMALGATRSEEDARFTGEVTVPLAVSLRTLACVKKPPRWLSGGSATRRY